MDTKFIKFLLSFLTSITLMAHSSGVIAYPIPPDPTIPPTTTVPSANPVNPPTTTFPTPVTNNPGGAPVNNPVTTLPTPITNNSGGQTVNTPVTPLPTPSTNTPVTPLPTPSTNNPGGLPVNNPVTPLPTPSTNNPGGQTVNNPVTPLPTPKTGSPVTNPAVAPPAGTTAPAISGQSWCVARSGVPESSIQAALDYACGIGGADCSAIQQSGSCYNPNSLQNHASYAINSYYQKNPGKSSCDFKGAAVVTNVNPSTGSCIFPTSSSSTSPTVASPMTTNPPTVASPTTTTPTTMPASGAAPPIFGVPLSILNASSPSVGGDNTGFGNSSENTTASSTSMISELKPFIGCISMLVTSIITGNFI